MNAPSRATCPVTELLDADELDVMADRLSEIAGHCYRAGHGMFGDTLRNAWARVFDVAEAVRLARTEAP